MGKGPVISPAVAGVIIVIVVVIVGFWLFRSTGAQKGGMSADQQAKMKEYTSKMGMGTPGARSDAMSTGGVPGGRRLSSEPPANAPR